MLTTGYARVYEMEYAMNEQRSTQLTSSKSPAAYGAVTAACAIVLGLVLSPSVALADAQDTMHLTDEPGNWYRSDATGTAEVVPAYEKVYRGF